MHSQSGDLGPLTAEIRWRVWGIPVNFNGIRILASLLHRRRSTEVNPTLRNIWPSPWLVHCVYILGGSLPLVEFCNLQFAYSLRPSLAFCYIGSVTARQSSSGRHRVRQTAAFDRGRHLYSAGRPSRWSSAHILVD